jgi:hypothetical protein
MGSAALVLIANLDLGHGDVRVARPAGTSCEEVMKRFAHFVHRVCEERWEASSRAESPGLFVTPNDRREAMSNSATNFLWVVAFVAVLSMTAYAQDQAQVFQLPDARVGEGYRAEIEQVLRDTYRLKLESGTRDAIIQWALAGGNLPPGLSVRTDGYVVGVPTEYRADSYTFRLRALDNAAKDDPLVLEFTVNLRAGGLRLVKFEGPRLSRVDAGDQQSDRTTSAKNASGSLGPPDSAPTVPADEPQKTAAEKAAEKANEAADAAQNPFSSMNRRFIVGFEQSGAASAESQGKPFIDMFLTTPLPFGRGPTDKSVDPLPKFSVWGNVRLNSTPQQVAALADVSSNAISAITEGKTNKLTLGLDFVVGPEIRLWKAGRTSMSAIAGFGAVTPLAPRESTQIFKTPDPNSSQGPRFYAKYAGALGKEFIAFTTPERDRFLRQYFAGFRFRTYKYKDDGNPDDVFPGMFDVTFGQNESVTGGAFHKFVVGLDGFYSLPFPDKSRFLYLFGSARFKALSPKIKETPFILDTAPSSVSPTDLNVFLADPTPSNRDHYRIGFGVDLIELFKFAKKPEAKDK